NKVSKAKENSAKATKDDLNISSEALDYQTALNAISKTPDIREGKIKDIMERINNGNYNVSSEEIANKILSN
ncbi:MAG: flagellar biosynthesis anti-sigma factor FlgM, partial [Eubacteriales bacterium]|nr:flagellar biosynthesis anti-sigma factor FlgM [Eubacteriales bacterium]